MHIDEAIKEIERLKVDLKYWRNPRRDEALQLGIEALICIKVNRGTTIHNMDLKLPGETEDETPPTNLFTPLRHQETTGLPL